MHRKDVWVGKHYKYLRTGQILQFEEARNVEWSRRSYGLFRDIETGAIVTIWEASKIKPAPDYDTPDRPKDSDK